MTLLLTDVTRQLVNGTIHGAQSRFRQLTTAFYFELAVNDTPLKNGVRSSTKVLRAHNHIAGGWIIY